VNNKNIQQLNKELSSHILRNTILLVGNSVLFSCIFQILTTISPIIILESTASSSLAGLTTSIIFSVDIVTNYHAGKIADIFGRKKTLLIGTSIGIIGLFVMTLSMLILEYSYYWLGLIIFGLSTGFWVINRVAIMDMYPKNRGQSLGYLQTGNFIGAFIAPLLLVTLSNIALRTGSKYIDSVFYSCIGFMAFSALLLIFIRKDPQEISKISEKIENESKMDNGKSWVSGIYTKLDLLLAFIISSLSVGAVSIVYSIAPIFLYDLEVEIWMINLCIALVSVGTGGLSIILGKIADIINRKKVILLGSIIAGIGLFILTLTRNYMVICICSLLVGIGGGAIAIASTSLICDMIPLKNRGKLFGANSLVINIISFGIPPLTTTLFSMYGPFSVSTLGLTLVLIVISSVIAIRR
jgi:MFS family permease